jgi:hypothetical protein
MPETTGRKAAIMTIITNISNGIGNGDDESPTSSSAFCCFIVQKKYCREI